MLPLKYRSIAYLTVGGQRVRNTTHLNQKFNLKFVVDKQQIVCYDISTNEEHSEGDLKMGYESRIIIARKGCIKGYVETIAEFNLCKVEGEFLNLFDKEYKLDFYDFYEGNNPIKEDRYGDPLKYATFNKVYKWLLDNVRKANYRRYDLLLGAMNAVREGWVGEINDFIIIHYGY